MAAVLSVMIRCACSARQRLTACCTVRACLSVKRSGCSVFDAFQDHDRRQARLMSQPGADLLAQIVEHRSTPQDRLPASVRASMRWALLAGTPSDAQPGSEAVKIRGRRAARDLLRC